MLTKGSHIVFLQWEVGFREVWWPAQRHVAHAKGRDKTKIRAPSLPGQEDPGHASALAASNLGSSSLKMGTVCPPQGMPEHLSSRQMRTGQNTDSHLCLWHNSSVFTVGPQEVATYHCPALLPSDSRHPSLGREKGQKGRVGEAVSPDSADGITCASLNTVDFLVFLTSLSRIIKAINAS